MNPRKKSSVVQLKVRLKEPLRARIEKAARKEKHPMNSEIVDRLEMSFSKEEKDQLVNKTIMDGVYGNFQEEGLYYLMIVLAKAITISEGETSKSWQDDADTFALVKAVFNSILSKYVHESIRQTEPANSELSEEIAGVLFARREGKIARLHLDEDRN